MAPDIATLMGRVATFHETHKIAKRRSSAQKKKTTTTVKWPHEQPAAMEMASAGFYYKPMDDSPDNVMCFHCGVSMKEWEETDNPTFEHCAVAPDCAWAKLQAVRQDAINPLAEFEDPTSEEQMQIRLDTFGDKWPHDSKKGWKPKSQKLAEAGWFYDPGPDDGEDGASCAYCGLSLDGWEPKDDPLEEHRKRAADCRFLTLPAHFKPSKKRASTSKRNSTAKRTRTSRASSRSRVSVASVASSVPDTYVEPEMSPPPAPVDLSTLSTSTDGASSNAQPPPKKTRGKKKKAAEESVVEIATEPEVAPQPIRGKKRTSDGAVKKQPKRATKKKIQVIEPSPEPEPEPEVETSAPEPEAIVEHDAEMIEPGPVVLEDTVVHQPEPEAQESIYESIAQHGDDVNIEPEATAEGPEASNAQRSSSPFEANVEIHAEEVETIETVIEVQPAKQKGKRTSAQAANKKTSKRKSDEILEDEPERPAKRTSRGRPSKTKTKAATPEPTPPTPAQHVKLWEPIDLENIFLSTPILSRVKPQLFDAGNQENISPDISVTEVIKLVQNGLTAAEKKMSVEEWIYHNAERQAEGLRKECEGMVRLFEGEGERARQVLEGLPVV